MWRFWTVADGLPESYTFSLGLGADGSLTARHGAVRYMSVLDGYVVNRISVDERTRHYARVALDRMLALR